MADIWEAAERAKGAQKSRGDGVLYVVGHKGSGKSTLIDLLCQREPTTRPTEGVDYTFLRRKGSGGEESVSHVFEIGGTDEFAKEVAGGDSSVFLNARALATAAMAIVVDGGKPIEALEAAEKWIQRAEGRLERLYARLERKGSKLPKQLKERHRRFFSGSEKDEEGVKFLGIPMLIAVAKQDELERHDGGQKKAFVKALRRLSQQYAASLFSFSSSTANAPEGNNAAQKALQAYLSHLAFTGFDRRPGFNLPPQFSHESFLVLPIGSDRFASIGGSSMEDLRNSLSQLFPTGGSGTPQPSEPSHPDEPSVDDACAYHSREMKAFEKRRHHPSRSNQFSHSEQN